jgi:hypothetical protein
METTKNNNNILLHLTNDEAIVLLEWLTTFNKNVDLNLFQDQSEQRVLYDMEAVLEQNVTETFQDNYQEVLSKARASIKDK